MEPKDEVGLAVFVGILVVWLIYGSTWIFLKDKHMPAKEEFSHVFNFRRDIRVLGLLMAVSSVGLLLFFSVAISPDNIKSGDWVIALILGGFMGGVGGITGVMLWCGRVYLGEKGVLGWSIFGSPVFIEWHELNRFEFSDGMQSYKLVGRQKSIYVPTVINDYEVFLKAVKTYAPKADFERGISVDPEKLIEDRYLKSIEKNSLKWMISLGVVVLISFCFLTPLYSALLVSFFAGVCLFSEALYMKLVNKTSSKVRKFIQFVGLFGFIVLTNISLSKYESYLGGESNIDGYMWFPLILQSTVSAVFFGFLLLVIVYRILGVKNS